MAYSLIWRLTLGSEYANGRGKKETSGILVSASHLQSCRAYYCTTRPADTADMQTKIRRLLDNVSRDEGSPRLNMERQLDVIHPPYYTITQKTSNIANTTQSKLQCSKIIW